jgi:hypothetical protein
LRVSQVNLSCFGFFFQLHPLTLGYWVLSFLIFYVFFLYGYLGSQVSQVNSEWLKFFLIFFLFNFNSFFSRSLFLKWIFLILILYSE